MKIEELKALWREECHIDSLKVTEESERSPLLHSKWNDRLMDEKTQLRALERDFALLFQEGRKFYFNPSEEGYKAGWGSSLTKGILRAKTENAVKPLVESDEKIIRAQANLDHQRDKVAYIESIMWEIARRKDHLNTIQRNRQFEAGM